MDDKEVNSLAKHITEELKVHLPKVFDAVSEADFVIEVKRATEDWQLK